MKLYQKLVGIFCAAAIVLPLAGCDGETSYAGGADKNVKDTAMVTDKLTRSQQTPVDIEYSMERYNLIRRAYWVNGQREKADSLPCPVEKPLGYVVLFAGNATVGRFVVDGKVSSLNSFLSPEYVEDSEYHPDGGTVVLNEQLADVDGSYGENDNGIFFFTPDGNYMEWTGEYLYSDLPFEVDSPVLRVQEESR